MIPRKQWMSMLTTTICVALLGTMAGLNSCTRRAAKPKGTADATKSDQTAANAERYLNFGNLDEPEYLDPGLMQGTRELNIAMALFEGLVEFDPKNSHAVPGVAERWDLSPDGKTLTFHLRKNAVWSDGHSVTAHDFAYAWERVLNPKTGSEYAFALYYIVNGEDYNQGKITDPTQLGFKAVDDATFEVRLKNPTPFFVDFAASHTMRPVPRWAIEQHGNNWTRPEHIVTNGAFLLKRWMPHKEIVVVKNPKYWDAANVKGQGIRFLPIDDRETAFKMYESGQLDLLWEVPTLRVQALMNRPDFLKGPFLRNEYYALNVSKPPLNDVRVRKALAMAIDRKTLCEQYLKGLHIASSSFTPTGLTGYLPPPGLDFNPTEARRLLAEAGFADPTTFPTLTLLYNTDEQKKLTSEVVQQMWKANLGITVQLQNVEWKSWLKELNQKTFQIARAGWGGDYLDPNTYSELLTTTSTQNHSGWSNEKYDHLFAVANMEVDPAKRLELLRQAEAIALDEAPVIPLHIHQKVAMVKPNVRGFTMNLLDIHPAKWLYIE